MAGAAKSSRSSFLAGRPARTGSDRRAQVQTPAVVVAHAMMRNRRSRNGDPIARSSRRSGEPPVLAEPRSRSARPPRDSASHLMPQGTFKESGGAAAPAAAPARGALPLPRGAGGRNANRSRVFLRKRVGTGGHKRPFITDRRAQGTTLDTARSTKIDTLDTFVSCHHFRGRERGRIVTPDRQ